MKKTLLFLSLAALMTAGCSKTWSGIKQDSSELLIDTKEAIHEATAPEPMAQNNVYQSNQSIQPASNRVIRATNNTINTQQQQVTASTITPIRQGSVRVFEDTPTVVNTAN